MEYFAYPYGLSTERDRNLVKGAGYALACSARSGFNRRETDPLFLRRIDVYGTDPVWKVAQKMNFGINDASLFTPARYYWRRLLSRFA